MRNPLLLPVLSVLFAAGCSPRWQKNVVGQVTGRAAGKRPDATVRVADGKVWRLSAFYGEATLIAFTDKVSSEPDSLLLAASHRLRGRITTVEVVEPAAGSEAHAKRAAERGEQGRHLVSLFDEHGIVRKQFGAPPNSALVIDRWGAVVARGSLGDLDSLADEAQSLLDAIDQQLVMDHF